MEGMARRTLLVSAAVALLATAQALNSQGPAPASASQGWTSQDQRFWYWTTQGSRLMPASWVRALERAEDQTPFLAPANINRYRYLTSGMQDGLPVGFAVDRQDDNHLERTRLRWRTRQGDDEPWIGLTCAACHTSEIAVGTRRLRIDGAPGMGDFQRMVEDIDRALHALRDSAAATAAGKGKWRRFTAAVLGRRDNDANRAMRLRALGEHIARRDQVAAMNRTPIRYGFSRVDAIGYIYNQASLLSGANPPTANMPTAPVSYPFLWNVPQHDRVQWNGSVDRDRKKILGHSLDIGAMGRNAGEVVGVFGEVRTDDRGLLGYRSSVHPLNLARLEVLLQRLQPPSWRQEMPGTIDEAAAARGQRIFERACSGCHAPLDRDDLGTTIVADLSYFGQNPPNRKPVGTTIPEMPNIPPGTDPLMACNAFFRTARTGNLADSRFGSGPLGPNASVLGMLSVTVKSALAEKAKQIVKALARVGGQKMPPPGESAKRPRMAPPAATASANPFPGLPSEYQPCINYRWTGKEAPILGYKARPLTGIWATAPYLHNGSVPNLFQLLLPPERRMQSFWLGTRQFDTVDVGFATGQSDENVFRFDTRDPQGNVIWGNFNGGHDYGNAALDANGGRDRRDLVEYLKTL